MLRSVLALSVLAAVSASPAFAMPKVGDHADYVATVTDAGKSVSVSAVIELVQQDGAKYLQRTTVTYPGQQPKVTDEWKQGDDLLTEAKIDEILANCTKEGGKLEQITVPAGSFQACAIQFDDEEAKGTEWVTKVPFGTARVSYVLKANNKAVDMQLKAFR